MADAVTTLPDGSLIAFCPSCKGHRYCRPFQTANLVRCIQCDATYDPVVALLEASVVSTLNAQVLQRSLCPTCGEIDQSSLGTVERQYHRCSHCATAWGAAGSRVDMPIGHGICLTCHSTQPMFEDDGRITEVCFTCLHVRKTISSVIKSAEKDTCYKCGKHSVLIAPVPTSPEVQKETCQDCGASWLRMRDITPPNKTEERLMALDMNADTSQQDKLVQALDVLIRARYPLIAVETHEEPRLLRIMATIASLKHHAEKGLYSWSRIDGIRQIGGPGMKVDNKPVPSTQDPISALEWIADQDKGLFLLCDFAPYLAPYGNESPELVRQLRELAWSIKAKAVTLFLVGPQAPDIDVLAKEMKVIDLALPDEAEVTRMLDFHLERLDQNPQVKNEVDSETHTKLVSSLLGLSEVEIENVIAKSAITYRGVTPAALPIILEEKKDAIRQSGSLEYHSPEPLSHYGGYAHVRTLLQEAALTFSPEAKEYGVDESKGFLLIGLPGVGKDLLKRVASGVLGRPLVDFDFGSVMGEGGGIVGQAAMSIKRALAIADTIKPVLGISEFEKGVGGLASSGRSDGGETARTIGMLLNWMQEQSGTFVVATANDVRQLAPEQVRQGRFSNILFVDLPTYEDRKQIFSVWLARKNRNPEDFDLDLLAEATDGYSGAEIEAVVKGALLISFADGARPLRTEDLLRRREKITPIGVLKRDEINEIREWAKDHLGAVDAGAPIVESKTRTGERSLEF